MTIALIIMMPITAMVVGFLVLKSVQLGLRWQVQVAQKQEPTMENPVAEVIENKQVDKINQDTANMLDEYLNGPKEGR